MKFFHLIGHYSILSRFRLPASFRCRSGNMFHYLQLAGTYQVEKYEQDLSLNFDFWRPFLMFSKSGNKMNLVQLAGDQTKNIAANCLSFELKMLGASENVLIYCVLVILLLVSGHCSNGCYQHDSNQVWYLSQFCLFNHKP